MLHNCHMKKKRRLANVFMKTTNYIDVEVLCIKTKAFVDQALSKNLVLITCKSTSSHERYCV